MTRLPQRARENPAAAGNDIPAPQSASSDDPPSTTREVRFEFSPAFASLLEKLRVSLLVSTYQAGKLVAVSANQGGLSMSFHNFQQVMGVGVSLTCLAVGTQGQIWFLQSAADIAARVEPLGSHDACYLTRRSFYTGEIQVHELAWASDELWIVNTAFSCLCTLHESFSFVP